VLQLTALSRRSETVGGEIWSLPFISQIEETPPYRVHRLANTVGEQE
jgi:hypothetical protein